MVFSLRQDGATITGELDEVGDGFFNFNAGGPIEDGRIDGSTITFRVGGTTYSGTAAGDRIELKADLSPRRSAEQPAQRPAPRASGRRTAARQSVHLPTAPTRRCRSSCSPGCSRRVR